ncbi:MAG TPA: M67 family metallopeptidase [Anaerolineales bacterium]|nr:M67 family metallopeptidase [Anaerolineales bacterium]
MFDESSRFMISQLFLAREHLLEMIRYVRAHAPLEACGLLAGRETRVEKVIEIRNQAQSPVRFVMDPYEQLKAFEWIESNGMELLGIFHSHPAGPETVSVTDIAEAAYEVVYVILSRSEEEWKARGFWIENGAASEIPLIVE